MAATKRAGVGRESEIATMTTRAPNESPLASGEGGAMVSWIVFALVHAGLLTFTAAMVYYSIFSRFTFYDDEGFMMMTVRHVLDGHRPYDDVVTAYGPVYYLYKWVLHGLVGLPLTHDVVRLNTAVLWLATGVLSAGVVFSMTRSLTLSVVTHVLVVLGLGTLANEPGHPQEMGVIGIAALVLASGAADEGERKRGIVILGLFVGLLTMIKINLGVFAGAAVWMALISTLRVGPASLALRAVSTVGIVALPVLLTWRQIDYWSQYTGTEVAAVLSVALMVRAGSPGQRGVASLATLAAAAVAGIALGLLFPFIKHASLSGLVDSLVVLPGRLADVVVMQPPTKPWGATVASAAVLLALFCACLAPSRLREGKTAAAVALAKLVFGVWAALAFWVPRPDLSVLPSGAQFVFSGLTPFLWLVLLPGVRGAPRRAGPLPRLVLVWVAVLQPLQAYPVPGSQYPLGIFLHLVCAMVALGDVRDWVGVVFPRLARPALRWVVATMAIAAVVVLTQGRLAGIRWWYNGLKPLGMPGAGYVRVPAAEGEALRSVADILRANADTFLTYPGFNSLYFWTGKRPPTLDILSHDVKLYSEQRQAAMVDALLAYDHPYVVRFRGLAQADPAFTKRIERYFEPSTRIGVYTLLVRRAEPVYE